MVVIAIISAQWWNVNITWWELSGVLILSASLAVFEFVVSKNDITPSSSYALWVTAVLSLLYLTFNVTLSPIIALFFIMLALRRLLSLKTDHSTIKKIFDATFWIAIATIFYHWSALFYLVVYVAIFLYARNDFRHWVTPLIAMGCVWFLLFTYDYVWENQVVNTLMDSYQITYLWSNDFIESQQVILLILVAIAVLGLLIYLSKLIDIQQSVRPRFTIITFTGLCAMTIAILDFDSFASGGFLLLIAALGILIARLAHSVNHRVFVELLLWFPILLLISSFLLR